MANLKSFKRVAHLEYLPMPGGERAILEPWRMSVSYLVKYLNSGVDLAYSYFAKHNAELNLLHQAIEKEINSPLTSRCGRLYDAVAANIGNK